MKLILENWRKFTLSQNQPNKIMISEMFVRGEPEGTNIVAHRENIWKLTDQPSEDIKREIDETLGIETEWDDFFELNQALEEEYRADVLVGQLERSSLSLNLEIDKAGRYRLDPKSSVLVKKVAKELGVRNVSYRYDNEADDEEVVSSYDRKGKVAKIMYHGTCSEYLNKILRLGLVPGRSDTNYEGIIHPDAIFFSSRFEESIYHSFHTAQRAGGDPVVVSLKVPDPALLMMSIWTQETNLDVLTIFAAHFVLDKKKTWILIVFLCLAKLGSMDTKEESQPLTCLNIIFLQTQKKAIGIP